MDLLCVLYDVPFDKNYRFLAQNIKINELNSLIAKNSFEFVLIFLFAKRN